MRLIDADKLIEVFEEYDMYLWRLPKENNPYETLIKLDDGRVIRGVECQYTFSI